MAEIKWAESAHHLPIEDFSPNPRNPKKHTKKQLEHIEPHPVKRTEKKYKVFPASSHSLLAAFYAARQSVCFSIGVRTPRLRWTRLVL